MLIALLLTGGMVVVQDLPTIYRYETIGGLSLLTALLTLWSLRGDLYRVGWLMAPILPTLFTASVHLFYFLLPQSLLVRVILYLLYAIGMYAILLTVNIYTVAAIRTIQLIRAAHALGFVCTLLIAFLLYDTILSYRLEPWINAALVLVASLPIVFQGVWCSRLEETISKDVILYTLGLTWFLGQMAFFISLWPVSIVIASLFLVTAMYVGLGVVQQALVGRLFRKTVREYLQVGVAVLVIVYFAAKWGG